MDYDFLFKVIIIGDSGVGKSSILSRYSRNEFDTSTSYTIGIEFSTCEFYIDGKRIKITIWDTAGQERFRSATYAYYRGSLGAFVVFDITNRESFLNTTRWLKELREHVDGDLIEILVGNKLDSRHLRAVSEDEAKYFAEMNNMHYIETSALNGTNIKLAFKNLVEGIYKKISNSENERPISINLTLSPDSNKKCC